MQKEYVLEMDNIVKSFAANRVLDGVTIRIKPGEVRALMGENGAGKSTLMSMLFGMYEPDDGEIFIRGKKEKIDSPNYATKLNIGMVHQHFKLVDVLSATENIVLGLEGKLNIKEASGRAMPLCKLCGKADYAAGSVENPERIWGKGRSGT